MPPSVPIAHAPLAHARVGHTLAAPNFLGAFAVGTTNFLVAASYVAVGAMNFLVVAVAVAAMNGVVAVVFVELRRAAYAMLTHSLLGALSGAHKRADPMGQGANTQPLCALTVPSVHDAIELLLQ